MIFSNSGKLRRTLLHSYRIDQPALAVGLFTLRRRLVLFSSRSKQSSPLHFKKNHRGASLSSYDETDPEQLGSGTIGIRINPVSSFRPSAALGRSSRSRAPAPAASPGCSRRRSTWIIF